MPSFLRSTLLRTAGISSIPFFTLRTFNLDVGDSYRFDELRVGTIFADVVPEPEPGSALLALIGAVFAFTTRRRQA